MSVRGPWGASCIALVGMVVVVVAISLPRVAAHTYMRRGEPSAPQTYLRNFTMPGITPRVVSGPVLALFTHLCRNCFFCLSLTSSVLGYIFSSSFDYD
ncbi:hypothetical protein E2C01_075466 [Portunus trituberculatus]|uniref:Uncharacterized protein n=1 Tax=Portunus trituberculatus TaxID=210409 RepID=A0A5B7I656_PORTR|nr:hypothetical protein [Portunus trituberculatus]